MKRVIFISLITLIFSSFSLAQDSIVFSCFTAKGKHIAVVESDGYYEYSFGKPGKPELFFKNKIVDVEERSDHWNGVGAWEWVQYNLKNGEYYYLVNQATNRMTEEHEMEGSVTVYKGNKELATINCDRF